MTVNEDQNGFSCLPLPSFPPSFLPSLLPSFLPSFINLTFYELTRASFNLLKKYKLKNSYIFLCLQTFPNKCFLIIIYKLILDLYKILSLKMADKTLAFWNFPKVCMSNKHHQENIVHHVCFKLPMTILLMNVHNSNKVNGRREFPLRRE